MSYLADIARSVKRYDPADKAALRAFQAEYFGPASRQCDDRHFEWLFERNPYRDTVGPTLWLCKRDGMVVGQQASIPVMLKAHDLEYRAAWGMDLMVHKDWRLRGVAPALTAAYEDSAEITLGAAMSDAAHRAFLRRGWVDLGFLPFWVRPLDLAACAKSTHVPKLLAKLTPGLLTRGSAYAAGRIIGGLGRSSLEPVAAFDERSDQLWTSASPDYGVLVRRDLRYLRWRFDEIPGRTGYERYYMIRKGEVLGYAVIRLEFWRGSTVGRVVDYLAPRASLRALLALVIETLNSKRAAAVFVEQLHHRSEGVLRSLGCFRAPAATRFIFNARSSASPLRGLLADRHDWYVSPADSDLEHEAMHAPG
jgi:GNAT superfamily N-acetyltransferase